MRRIGLVLGMSCALVSATTGVALARDTTGTTTTSFEIYGGELSITTAASADLGTATPGTTLSGQLGAVTVTDDRAALEAAWTATASTTDFTTGAATANETVTKSNVSYWSGPATATTGTGTFTPGQATSGSKVALSAPATAFSLTGGVGSNSAAWNPTLVVAMPGAAVAGTYTGTVTHSVT